MVVRQSLGNWQSLSTFRKESTKKFDLSWLISKVCAYWFSLISMGMSRFKLIVNQTFSVCKVEAKLHPSCLQVVPQATPKVAPNCSGDKTQPFNTTVVQVILFEIDCIIFYTNLHEWFCKFIIWTNRVNSGKFMDNCYISFQVIDDMKKNYDNLMNINL